MKHLLPFVFLACLVLVSCKKKNELPSLPGTWQEVNEQPNFGGSDYRITFIDDGSFRLTKSLWSDALMPPGTPCNTTRVQYVHGNYTASGSSLLLTGRFCDSSFNSDVPDCAQGATFKEQHSMSGKGNWMILDDESGDWYRIYLSRQ